MFSVSVNKKIQAKNWYMKKKTSLPSWKKVTLVRGPKGWHIHERKDIDYLAITREVSNA